MMMPLPPRPRCGPEPAVDYGEPERSPLESWCRCPVCGRIVPEANINAHLDDCVGAADSGGDFGASLGTPPRQCVGADAECLEISESEGSAASPGPGANHAGPGSSGGVGMAEVDTSAPVTPRARSRKRKRREESLGSDSVEIVASKPSATESPRARTRRRGKTGQSPGADFILAPLVHRECDVRLAPQHRICMGGVAPGAHDGDFALALELQAAEDAKAAKGPELTCGICLEVHWVDEMYTVDCSLAHRFCFDCMYQHVRSETLDQGRPARCPLSGGGASGCGFSLTQGHLEQVLRFGVDSEERRRDAQRILDVVASMDLANLGLLRCPACSAPLETTAGHRHCQ